MIVLFEKTLQNTYFIRLTVDYEGDDVLTAFRIQTVSVIESLMHNSTYMNVKFIDGGGELLNDYPIIPDSEFTITYGRSHEESVVSKFKLSTISMDQMSTHDTNMIAINIDTIHDKWESLFKKTVSRSWSNKKYSEIVKLLMDEIGVTDTEIEETNITTNVIQPEWTNAQLLKWIAKNATSTNGSNGFVYYLTLKGKFVFTTYDSLYNKKPVKTIDYSNVNIYGDGANLLSVDVKYMPTLNNGGFGLNYTYFDYDNKEFVNDSKTITDINEKQISDWYYISESHNEPSKRIYGGRDTRVVDSVNNRIILSSNSVQKIDIFVGGDTTLNIGDIVDLNIPVPEIIRVDVTKNEMYSGRWLVWKIAHLFDGEKGDYYTHLFLTRNGINGKRIKGLIKTDTGKQLKWQQEIENTVIYHVV